MIEATDRVMRRYGREQRECYVWWTGYFTSGGYGQVLTAICPEVRSSYGRIHLGRRDLTALHSALRSLDQVLLVELHTHPPGAGGQNDTDAENAASTHQGFISIVVPNFAEPHLYDLRQTWVYEYAGQGNWRQLTREEIEQRFIVEPSFVSVAAQ